MFLLRTFVLFLSTIPYAFMGIRMEMGHDSLLHLCLLPLHCWVCWRVCVHQVSAVNGP
jgi:hypothetical protein